jgi:8-oxo-dGTP pyrophosphatase MutT (NUDIX family)
MNEFPRGIEVINGLIIRNAKGEILLATGKKWSHKWVVTGGHVEPGETILQSAVREGQEETGLQLKPVCIINSGEMINPEHFHRPAHFVFFNCLLEAESDEVKLLDRELTEYSWVSPEEAMKFDCNPTTHEAVKAYIDYLAAK